MVLLEHLINPVTVLLEQIMETVVEITVKLVDLLVQLLMLEISQVEQVLLKVDLRVE